MKILLACSSGMSTSLLVNKMKEAAQAKYAPKGQELNIPVEVIAPVSYGRCDGKAVLKQAMDLINNK